MTSKGELIRVDRERLKRLAAFAPIFRNPNIVFGKWHPSTGQGTREDPLIMPWFEMGEAAARFIDVANGFIDTLKDFDWTKWIQQPEGRKLSGSLNAIASADGKQLAKLSLALVRQDRFSEGTLAKAYDDKILLKIVVRAETLLNGRAAEQKKDPLRRHR